MSQKNESQSSNKRISEDDEENFSSNKKIKTSITQNNRESVTENVINDDVNCQDSNEKDDEYDEILDNYLLEPCRSHKLRAWVWQHFTKFKVIGRKK